MLDFWSYIATIEEWVWQSHSNNILASSQPYINVIEYYSDTTVLKTGKQDVYGQFIARKMIFMK